MNTYTPLLFSCLFACGPTTPKATEPQAEYPAILHPARELTPDFSVQQHIQAKAHGRSGAFDAVVQKRAGELVIVGLGPASVRMFVLKQGEQGVTFEQSFGPRLPFPPRNILVDVHRAFFKRLPSGEGATRKGIVDDEDVHEVWRGDELQERRFWRKDGSFEGPVTITYGKGCTATRCAPNRIHIENPWFGYELEIDNSDYQFFDDPPAPETTP